MYRIPLQYFPESAKSKLYTCERCICIASRSVSRIETPDLDYLLGMRLHNVCVGTSLPVTERHR